MFGSTTFGDSFETSHHNDNKGHIYKYSELTAYSEREHDDGELQEHGTGERRPSEVYFQCRILLEFLWAIWAFRPSMVDESARGKAKRHR